MEADLSWYYLHTQKVYIQVKEKTASIMSNLLNSLPKKGDEMYVPASRATPLARRPGRKQIYGEPSWGTCQSIGDGLWWLFNNFVGLLSNTVTILVITALACTGLWSAHGGRSGSRSGRRALSTRCLFPGDYFNSFNVSIVPWIVSPNFKSIQQRRSFGIFFHSSTCRKMPVM